MRVALIPARGGSKRIPKKNIKHFDGKPIIMYSIEAAIKSKLFDKIIISTDCENIKETITESKLEVEVWSRSEKNSDDFSTISDVVCEVLSSSVDLGIKIDEFALIYATAPLVSYNDLIKSFEQLDGADVVLPIVEYSYPIQRSLLINQGGSVELVDPDEINTRSQDLEGRYHDTGLFFWSRACFFIKSKNLFKGKIKPYIMSELFVQDVDTEVDWKLCEMKYRYLRNENLI
jgi:pseudaminic acid cytidylyltransferase